MNNEEQSKRNDLIKALGNELSKSIYKQLTINEKYTQYDFNIYELSALWEIVYLYTKLSIAEDYLDFVNQETIWDRKQREEEEKEKKKKEKGNEKK